jgi:predicted lipoprotein with Yx(FWY)xxD motif
MRLAMRRPRAISLSAGRGMSKTNLVERGGLYRVDDVTGFSAPDPARATSWPPLEARATAVHGGCARSLYVPNGRNLR